MKKILVFVSVVLFCSFPGVNGQNAKHFLKAGEEFLKKGKYEDAIDQFTKAVQKDPGFTEAYIQRATVYASMQKFEESAKDYERALVFETKNPSLYYKSAYAHHQIGNDSIAAIRVNSALQLKRSYIDALQLSVLVFLSMEKYPEAVKASKTALKYKETAENYYNCGLVNDKIGAYNEAEKAFEKAISKNSRYKEAYVKLADLQRRLKKYPQSLANCNKALSIDPKFADAYIARSLSYGDQLKYPEAINDLSTLILMDPDNPAYFYQRGIMYQDFAQHPSAVNDFNKVISLNPKNPDTYYRRAFSYEQMMKYEEAIKDYEMLSSLSKYDAKAREHLAEAQSRLYELNRETVKPVIFVEDPPQKSGNILNVPKGTNMLPLSGKIKEQSQLKTLVINQYAIPFEFKDGMYEFHASVNLSATDKINIHAADVYDNAENVTYTIQRTETDPPVIRIIAPYASDNNVIYLDTKEPTIYVEGTITDESFIKSINIDGVLASFVPTDQDPTFQAYINVLNKDRFTVTAIDALDNVAEVTYKLNREAADISAGNPMGKTWVIFIENSNYENFASLEGPGKDITMMKSALAKYSIHNFIHKKDMTKVDMEKFFSIELRDLLRSNRVNSILIWYAGHGKYINETGYWVPVNAKRDDEFTYYNINALKASMQSYPREVSHTLIITDACESGPSFYQAMRGALKIRDCSDWTATRLKSSQVFSSAGYELAVDNSQFTRTFANVLANSPDICIPIESIVQKVTTTATQFRQQKPQFGKISGLEDEDGTFFFMVK